MQWKKKFLNIHLITIVILLTTLSSCNETIPKRTTISPNQIISDPPQDCLEGQTKEVNIVEETGEEIITCVDPLPTRPSGAVLFKSDFCGCKDGKAITFGNCSNFCSSQFTDNKEVFFANFTTTPEVALSGLNSVDGWCRQALEGDKTNPKCVLEAKTDEGTSTSLDVTPLPNSNSIKVEITQLPFDKTLVLTLVESVSGARSNSIQIIKFSSTLKIDILGPLKNAPISQYSCLIRQFMSDDNNGSRFYIGANRLHYYFIPRQAPDPVPTNIPQLICHDIFNTNPNLNDPETDSISYNRLELIPGIFNMWDGTDRRFYDIDGNGSRDVDDIIIQKTKDFGTSISSKSIFFNELKWPGQPITGDENGPADAPSQVLGFLMAPWMDQTTFKSYCLNSTHYNSDSPLFKAIRDVIQVDTEGLYAAKSIEDDDKQDRLLIRETILKQVWFYFDKGVPTAPTEENVAGLTVYFYYPINYDKPYVKNSSQRTYKVDDLRAIFGESTSTPSNGNLNTGIPTNYPSHDKKIGCIPKF